MADEPENHTLALLCEMRERFEKVDAEAAATKAEILKLRVEVAEGTTAAKDVAVQKGLNAMGRV
jgi:hypothetical protein